MRNGIIGVMSLVILLYFACLPVTANESVAVNGLAGLDNLSGVNGGIHTEPLVNTPESQSEIAPATAQELNQTAPYQVTPNSSCLSCKATIQPEVPASLENTQGSVKGVQNTQNTMKGVMIVTVQKGAVTTKNIGAVTPDSIDVLIRKDVTAYPQKNPDLSLHEFDNLPTIELLNPNNTVIYSTKFVYQEVMTVPMQSPGQVHDSVPSQIRVAPFATLVLPYLPEGQNIRIIDENGHVVNTVPLENYGIIDQDPVLPDIVSLPSSPGTFNLLILASGYTPDDMYKFTYRAGQVQNIISAAQPFNAKSQSLAVSFYPNTNDVGCYTGCAGIDRLLCCDDTKVISAAVDSGTLFDEIIVIHNTATYAGSGSRDFGTYKTNSYSSFGTVYDGPYSGIMALHEFGHSFGDLCDEYSYGTEGYSYYPCVNCRASCSDWSSFSSICTLGCDARRDFFRPDNSVMLDFRYTTYNQASIKAEYSPDGLEKRLNFFLTTANPVAANFIAFPTSGNAPLAVQFTDTSIGSPTSWYWNFGDGSYDTSQNPYYIYSGAGSYSVELTASNSEGSDTLTRTNYITVSSSEVAPVADFVGTPTSGTAPLIVTFTDTSTGSPTSWYWNFGDGSYDTSQNPYYIYSGAGSYSVELTATNSEGSDTLTRTNYITVSSSEVAPVADFVGTPTSGTAPLIITFTDTSTGSPTSWNWSFGDGNFSEVKDPVYTYVSAGSYTVSLLATNAVGSDTKTVANYITVNAPSGVYTVGVFRNGSFYLKDATAFGYGLTGDTPIAGDWMGTGVDTVGVFRNGSFYLKDGPSFAYGLIGDKPVAGNWTGDRTTGVGVFRDGLFFLRNSTGSTEWFAYGQVGDSPIAGDWNGDGTTKVGVFRDGVFYLRANDGSTYAQFGWGLMGDSPVAGDWNGDRKTEVGVFRDGSFYLRAPDGSMYSAFGYGLTGDTPIAGKWI